MNWHGHLITGDLSITDNAKLGQLVAEGPKYREPNRAHWKATETKFLNPLVSMQSGTQISLWKDQLKESVADRILSLKGLLRMFEYML